MLIERRRLQGKKDLISEKEFGKFLFLLLGFCGIFSITCANLATRSIPEPEIRAKVEREILDAHLLGSLAISVGAVSVAFSLNKRHQNCGDRFSQSEKTSQENELANNYKNNAETRVFKVS